MRPWWDRRMCCLDLETTGVDPESARIVTAAVGFVGGGDESDLWTTIVDPGVEIPDAAAAIHGVTTQRARAEGEAPADVLAKLVTWLAVAADDHFAVVIFNSPYDLTVLDRELRRHALGSTEVLGAIRVVDPLVLDKHLDRYRKGSRKLEAQAQHYQATLDAAHDAAFDALCAARLAWAIGKRGRVVRRVRNAEEGMEFRQLCGEWERVRFDLDLLQEAQQRWARAELVRFAEYKRSQGELEAAADIESRDWPIIPLREPVAALSEASP